METPFNFPEYKEEQYGMNSATGYYEKQPKRITFNKLPYELKVEETQEAKIRSQGANEIIHGRIKNGKYQFFTGLISAGVKDWYFGNHYEFINGGKKLSLVIFQFAEDNSCLTVYFFNWYYKENRNERINFVSLFINKKTKEAITPPLFVQFSEHTGQNLL